MAKPRSLLLPSEVDVALSSHNCQRNPAHRIVKGDKRLKVKLPKSQRSPDHYCVSCSKQMIELAIKDLKQLAADLE